MRTKGNAALLMSALLWVGCQTACAEDEAGQPDAGRATNPPVLRVAMACPADMIRVSDFCVDRYEASVWDSASCDGAGTQYGIQKEADDFPESWPVSGQYQSAADALYACSIAGVPPSGWVTWFRAAAACAESQKRLCTNQEWQLAALGTDRTACSIDAEDVEATDAHPGCTSRWGVMGMAGGVQEWVADWVVSGGTWYTGEEQQAAGFSGLKSAWPAAVGATERTFAINGTGVSGTEPDYSHEPGLPNALMRGGSFSNGEWAGPLNVNAGNTPTVAYRSGGFRCCATVYTTPQSVQ